MCVCHTCVSHKHVFTTTATVTKVSKFTQVGLLFKIDIHVQYSKNSYLYSH